MRVTSAAGITIAALSFIYAIYLGMLNGEGYRENVLPIDHLTPNPS